MSAPVAELRTAMADVNRILQAATDLFGSVDKAVAWFRGESIEQFDGLTPMQLVEQGRPKAVMDYLESIGAGPAG